MHLTELGELGFIKRFASKFSAKNIPGIEGIGDDCAVIPFHNDLSYLITTDILLENFHFIKNQISPEDLGYKSVAVNLSDIAAMGGTARFAFLSLGLPINTTIEWTDAFFSGFKNLADKYQILLLGGDTTRSDTIVINVFIVGVIETSTIKRRSEAIPGDVICCTGYLGDSGGGLKLISEGLLVNEDGKELIHTHFHPRPHLEEGAWLAKQPGVHAMIDLSDGLISDIQRIMEQSHCGAHLLVEHLPISKQLQRTSQLFHWSAENLALTSGEDYSLLVTIDPNQIFSLKKKYFEQFQRPLFDIGSILLEQKLICTNQKKDFIPDGIGFDHFNPRL